MKRDLKDPITFVDHKSERAFKLTRGQEKNILNYLKFGGLKPEILQELEDYYNNKKGVFSITIEPTNYKFFMMYAPFGDTRKESIAKLRFGNNWNDKEFKYNFERLYITQFK